MHGYIIAIRTANSSMYLCVHDIPIFGSKIPNVCALSTYALIRGHVLTRLSKFQFRQAADEDTMAAPHPKKPKVARLLYSKYRASGSVTI